jgi:hypothetical protein
MQPELVCLPFLPGASNENCVIMDSAVKSPDDWDDRNCSLSFPFVIEYECPLGFEFNSTGCQGTNSKTTPSPPTHRLHHFLSTLEGDSTHGLTPTGSGVVDVDIDVCALQGCPVNSTCKDEPAPSLNRSCLCDPGFVMDQATFTCKSEQCHFLVLFSAMLTFPATGVFWCP